MLYPTAKRADVEKDRGKLKSPASQQCLVLKRLAEQPIAADSGQRTYLHVVGQHHATRAQAGVSLC